MFMERIKHYWPLKKMQGNADIIPIAAIYEKISKKCIV